jgi:aldehyde dehydrogenase (NAD+)
MYTKANAPAVAHHGRTVIGFNWIGGKEVEGDLPSFDARSAVDSRDTVGIFPECGERDVERAARAATAALGPWSGLPAPARGEVIGRIGGALAAHQGKVAAVITRELGWPAKAAQGEVREALEACARFREAARRPPEGDRRRRLRPLGVCALLSGAGSPLAAPAWKLMAALACGDTVVWKPSASAPTTAYLLVRCLMDAGLAPGVVNVVNGRGRGACGKALLAGIGKGLFQKVAFCGAPSVGRAVAEQAGRALVPCALELGGRNPMIVMADADLDRAVAAALEGAFGAPGQRRALGNLILDREVAWAFREAFLAGAAELAVGNPVSDPEVASGPVANARCAKVFQEHWELGREDGARLLCGGAAWTEDNRSAQVRGAIAKGSYLQPCVWDEVTPDMRLFRLELAGPSVNLITVDGFDQALAWAQAAPHPAAAFLFGADRDRAGRFLRECRTGSCLVNDGGAAWSGNGEAERNDGWETGWTRWQRVVGAGEEGEPAAPAGPRASYEPSRWDTL